MDSMHTSNYCQRIPERRRPRDCNSKSIPSPSCYILMTACKGLSQVLLHFGEALAPALITSLFAYSLEHRILGGNLTYVALLVIGILGVIQAFTLEERVDHMDKIFHSSDVEDGHLEID